MDRIYLDHHATTPVDEKVIEAMAPFWRDSFGNPSSPHVFGWEAEEAVERAREQVSSLLSCRPSDIVFTSGGTESNNLAIVGIARRYRDRGRHFVTTAIEHSSILGVFRMLEEEGAEVTVIPVGKEGIVDPEEVVNVFRDDTVLCSVMWANNEIGTIQPVPELAQACRKRGVILHSDAVQAVGHIPVEASSADLLSLSGHKFHGPKGIGALVIPRGRPRIHLDPLMSGGGQEKSLRPGTLPVPLVVGLGKACEVARSRLSEEAASIAFLRDHLIGRLSSELEGVHLNGDATRRLPGNANLRIDGVEAEALLLEMHGVALGTGSACSSVEHLTSHVLLALGLDGEQAHSCIRFGIGRGNTKEEIDHVCDLVVDQVHRLRGFAHS